jgi:predicted nucleic acid-binding protein
MYLLNTNVISELRKGPRGNPQLLKWASEQNESDFYLSVITVLELERGVLRVESRDAAKFAILRRWMTRNILDAFNSRILDVTLPISLRAASLHLPKSKPEADALIAATALVNGLTLVTRNVNDFVGTGVQIVNPWKPHDIYPIK